MIFGIVRKAGGISGRSSGAFAGSAVGVRLRGRRRRGDLGARLGPPDEDLASRREPAVVAREVDVERGDEAAVARRRVAALLEQEHVPPVGEGDPLVRGRCGDRGAEHGEPDEARLRHRPAPLVCPAEAWALAETFWATMSPSKSDRSETSAAAEADGAEPDVAEVLALIAPLVTAEPSTGYWKLGVEKTPLGRRRDLARRRRRPGPAARPSPRTRSRPPRRRRRRPRTRRPRRTAARARRMRRRRPWAR